MPHLSLWSERRKDIQPGNDAQRSGFIVTKQANGVHRWVLISSSAFEDRDREIVSKQALQADVDRADADGDFGPLRWWHLPGADIGDCDFNMLHGRMLYESGTFRSPQVAEAVKAHAGELGASLGFTHPASEPDTQGIFHHIRRFERSLLPRELASNPFTAVGIIEKESQMTLIEDKLKAFGRILGGDAKLVGDVLAIGATKEAEADAAGIRTKAAQTAADDEAEEVDPATGKPKKPKTAAEAADEAAEDAGKKEYLGDMDPAAFKALLEDIVERKVGGLRTELQAALDAQVTTKAAADAATAETLKAYEAKLDGIAASATEALKGVQELKGELPRALGERQKGWRASERGDAPSEEQEKAAQNTGPDPADPLAKHIQAMQVAAGRVPAA